MNIANRLTKYGPSRMHVANELVTRLIARKCIAPGDCVIDLGANEGFHAFDFAECVGPNGKVHAFEPNPDLWKNFIDKAPIRLWPFAVGNDISMQNFYIPEDKIYHQVGSIVDPRDFIGDTPMKIVSVPQINIDSIKEIFDYPVTFVKIDVERRELQAIAGMTDLIRKFRPVIVLENVTSDIENLLESANYLVTPLLNCDNVHILANSMAVHSSRTSQIVNIVPDPDELNKVLNEVERQYPDDIA